MERAGEQASGGPSSPLLRRRKAKAPAFIDASKCGQAASRYVRIYRNGICSQCYRDDMEEAAMGY